MTPIQKATPRVSVIMIDGSFREKFHSLDFFNNQTLPRDAYEIIWVEFYNRINPVLKQKTHSFTNNRIITLKKQGEYHSSYCFNAGINESSGEIVVIVDADVVVDNSFLEKIIEEHAICENLVLYCYRYDEPQEAHVQEMDLDYLKNVCILTNPVNYGGCVSVRKKNILAVNGYEQHPIFSSGFHANGADLYTRFKNAGMHIKWHPTANLYHPWHPLTLILHSNHKKQLKIVDYRARRLMTLPFEGINFKKNSTVPADLMLLLQQKKRKKNKILGIFKKF